ncbi:hypothetical protein DPMN_134914 [Dreissena polymorpha]|uniref:Uncharacterized protein n=1 Tax=Dreissena polymorpha TaxID=45954 RepID=A0A9D4G0K4_DREPO|nr:hypothetical protein DPMN_134914 [Dreissena polymorpha]
MDSRKFKITSSRVHDALPKTSRADPNKFVKVSSTTGSRDLWLLDMGKNLNWWHANG